VSEGGRPGGWTAVEVLGIRSAKSGNVVALCGELVVPNWDSKEPLCQAAWGGHGGVVKILLGRDDVNPNKPDKRRQIPLLCAALRGHEGVVKILIEGDDVHPENRISAAENDSCVPGRIHTREW